MKLIVTIGFGALAASSSLAIAQSSDTTCKPTETQSECHTRLKCKANEEVADCQKRLLQCTASETLEDCEKRTGGHAARQQGNGGQQGNGRPRDNADQRRGDGDTDRSSRERDDSDAGRDRDNNSVRDRADRDDGGSSHRRGSRHHSGGHAFEANKTFGLGVELGEPSGLDGKYFVSKSGALDFGVGAIYHQYYYGDGFHIYADYLWHPVSLASTSAFELPFYIGGGLRYWSFNYCIMGVCDYGGSAVGIRVPFGLSFDFNNVPLDVFVQLVPVVDFLSGDYYMRYGDRTHLGIDFSAGIRFWFK